MPLNSRGEKRRSSKNVPPQKVIIPKGMINPDETTVIEIPARLHKQPIVVAKHKNTEIGQGLFCGSVKNAQRPDSANYSNNPKNGNHVFDQHLVKFIVALRLIIRNIRF